MDLGQSLVFIGAITFAWWMVSRPAIMETADLIDARRSAVRAYDELARDIDRVRGIGPVPDTVLTDLHARLVSLQRDWRDAGVTPHLEPRLHHSAIGPVLWLDEVVAAEAK